MSIILVAACYSCSGYFRSFSLHVLFSCPLLEGFRVGVNSPCRLGKTPIGDAGLSIITDGLKASPECGIRRLGCVSYQP